jgi:hypothetical protein
MQASEGGTVENPEVHPKPQQIASWGRLVGFLLIVTGVVALGFLAQHAPAGGAGTAAAGQLAGHGKTIQIYVTVALMDWALLYYCWRAVHDWGGNLWTLSGGRWTSWKSVAVDMGIAVLGALGGRGFWRSLAAGAELGGAGHRQDRRQPVAAERARDCCLDRGLDHGRHLRGAGISRVPAESASFAERERCFDGAGPGVGVWPVSRLSGLA